MMEKSLESLENMSDEGLVVLAKAGDKQAERCLLLRHRPLARLKSHSFFINGADVEDLFQEGMLGLNKAIYDYMPDRQASFRSFAELCIKRQILTAIKASLRKKHFPLNSALSLNKPVEDGEDDTLMDMLMGFEDNPETIYIENESYTSLLKRIKARLSGFENEVLDIFLDGKTYIEIAALMDKSPKAIDNALQRIKKKIKELL